MCYLTVPLPYWSIMIILICTKPCDNNKPLWLNIFVGLCIDKLIDFRLNYFVYTKHLLLFSNETKLWNAPIILIHAKNWDHYNFMNFLILSCVIHWETLLFYSDNYNKTTKKPLPKKWLFYKILFINKLLIETAPLIFIDKITDNSQA